jgi:beta-fructofuranosidase
LLYTGVRNAADGPRRELPCLATSRDDDLVTWEKYAGNPIIPAPPPGFDVLGFRDHRAWREDGAWYQLIGSGIRGVGGTAFLYRSADLLHWEYLHPICVGDRRTTGDIWECPDLFPLGERHLLMVSPIPLWKTLYFVGSFREHRFEAQHTGVVDEGGYFYAPQSFADERGRRIMFGWLWEGRDEKAQRAAGWAGVLSLPRLLLPRSDGALGVEPAPELRSLRGRHASLANAIVNSKSTCLALKGSSLEIVAEFLPSRVAQVGLKVRAAPDGSEQTLIVYDPGRGWLSIDRQRSSLDNAVQREPHGTRLQLVEDEPLRLQVFVDCSVVEVYANARACLTSRVYPSRADSLQVEVFALGGPAHLRQLDVWEMGSIWSVTA